MRLMWIATAAVMGVVCGGVRAADDENELKFADCPPAVRKAFQTEAHGAKIETVTREKGEDGETVYWADATVSGRLYAIGVMENGQLVEMNLTVDDDELAFDGAPAPVQATLKSESFGEKIDTLGKDVKYGVTVYEAVVDHQGKSYEIVVAEDGTLVEKALVIDDDEVELAHCPAAVQTALRAHAKGGQIGDITRSTGITGPTYEAEILIHGKVYLIEVAEDGHLISKSLEASAV